MIEQPNHSDTRDHFGSDPTFPWSLLPSDWALLAMQISTGFSIQFVNSALSRDLPANEKERLKIENVAIKFIVAQKCLSARFMANGCLFFSN